MSSLVEEVEESLHQGLVAEEALNPDSVVHQGIRRTQESKDNSYPIDSFGGSHTSQPRESRTSVEQKPLCSMCGNYR